MAGIKTHKSPTRSGPASAVNLSGSGTVALNRVVPHIGDHVTELNLNRNELYTLDGIAAYSSLQRLSVQQNHLVNITSIRSLEQLVWLDLQNNSLTDIAGFAGLTSLKWVCLAGNSIQHYAPLISNRQLQHVDLSQNCISHLEDIRTLSQLMVLLLHGNVITELNPVADYMPKSVSTLSLSENELTDITQLGHLSHLPYLEKLTLSGNPLLLPCHQLGVDCKPFVVSCCTAVKFIDGVAISEQDRQTAANVFPQETKFHTLSQEKILQQLIQIKQPKPHSPLAIRFPNNNGLLFPAQLQQKSSSTSHDVTTETSPTLQDITNNDSFITRSSPRFNHEGVTELSWQQHNKNLSLMGRSEQLVVMPTVMQHPHPSGVDMTLNKKVTTVQAYVRGHLTRKHIKPFKLQTKAATTIQAYWRGYLARTRDVNVMRCRAELNQRRVHRHILKLSSQLSSYQAELTHNAHMRQIQDETIRSLASEVEELQHWRDHVIHQQQQKAAVVIQKYWRGYQVRKFTKVTMVTSHSLSSLWSMCQLLKNQVEELQHAMATMATKPDRISPGVIPPTNHYPAPTQLQMTHYSNTCLLLEWCCGLTAHSEAPPAILSYRVYVNGIAEGQVGADKRRAYLEGLDSTATYRITVRSVFTDGESADSNPIIASLSHTLSVGSSQMTTPLSSFPPSPEKSVVAMTTKLHYVAEDSDKQDQANCMTEKVIEKETVLEENSENGVVKETSFVEEDTHSVSTTSTSDSEEIETEAATAETTEQKLRDTFTIVKEDSSTEQQILPPSSSPQLPQDTVHSRNSPDIQQSSPHNIPQESHFSQGESHSELKENPQDTRESPHQSVELPGSLQTTSQGNGHTTPLESLHSTSSSDISSSVATPTSPSPKPIQSPKKRKSFFPPIMDLSMEKPTEDDDSVLDKNDELNTSSSKELAAQLLSALEKELSNPLLEPTTST
ncbi:uncharacterized protein [Dysidea avara]|uniref:uncharacterized protein isoform X2 n=1 Tax=Dysidea avara TaxID=196820 RepID=UPI00332AAAAF